MNRHPNEALEPAEQAKLFRAQLDRLGWTQNGCARAIHVTERTVQFWASGTKRIPGTVWLLLELLVERQIAAPGSVRGLEEAIGPHLERLIERAEAAGWDADEVAAALGYEV